jgi:hypothetical protein
MMPPRADARRVETLTARASGTDVLSSEPPPIWWVGDSPACDLLGLPVITGRG